MGTIGEIYGFVKSRIVYDFRPGKKKKMERFYTSFLQPGGLGFDIGAHTGSRTAAWLNIGARVVALEPQPMFFQFLHHRFRNNSRCTLVREAAGGAEATGRLLISSNNPTVSSLSPRWADAMSRADGRIKWDGSDTVSITTLDSLIDRFGTPKFCKIDVEGFEGEVLKGLSRPLGAVSFEFYPGLLGPAIQAVERLKELGAYRFNYSIGETFRYELSDWIGADDILDLLRRLTGPRSGDVYAVLGR